MFRVAQLRGGNVNAIPGILQRRRSELMFIIGVVILFVLLLLCAVAGCSLAVHSIVLVVRLVGGEEGGVVLVLEADGTAVEQGSSKGENYGGFIRYFINLNA